MKAEIFALSNLKLQFCFSSSKLSTKSNLFQVRFTEKFPRRLDVEIEGVRSRREEINSLLVRCLAQRQPTYSNIPSVFMGPKLRLFIVIMGYTKALLQYMFIL